MPPPLSLTFPTNAQKKHQKSCDEVADEGVEVLVLRALLTAAASGGFSLHGQALLLAVRTCYNIYLMSR